MKKRNATEEDLADIRQTGIQYLLDKFCRKREASSHQLKEYYQFSNIDEKSLQASFVPVLFWDKVLSPDFDPFRRGFNENGGAARFYLTKVMKQRARELRVKFCSPDKYSKDITQILKEVQDYSLKRYEKLQVLRNQRELALIRSPNLLLDLFGEDAVILLTGDCGAGKSFLVNQLRTGLENLPITDLVFDEYSLRLERSARTVLHVMIQMSFWEMVTGKEKSLKK
jgi:hypothetical protein